MGDYVGCVFLVVGYYVSHCVGCMHGIFVLLKHRHDTDCTQDRSGHVTIVCQGDAPLETPNDAAVLMRFYEP